MARIRRSPVPELRPDFTPLIDVVFLLLTFFIFAMVVMVRADTLDVSLPEVASGSRGDRAGGVTVTVDADGRVFVDRQPVALEQLAGAVLARREALGDPEARVLLAVDQFGRTGDLIRVANALAAQGLTEFSILGTPPRVVGPEQTQ